MSQYAYTGNIQLNNYPLSNPVNDCFRLTDKDANQCNINVYSNYWAEQLQLYGQRVDYYVNTTSTLSADMLYGEQPTAKYNPPVQLIFGINLNENALLLSKFGLVADDELTAFVHISSFYAAFGVGKEPKSGDVFSLSEYGNDRVGGRGPNFYEITQRLDQDIATINQLGGHYIWYIKAKRYEFSFEPGLSGEQVNQQVYEDSLAPGVSGATKPYTSDIDVEGKKIFDYSQTNKNDSVYGGY